MRTLGTIAAVWVLISIPVALFLGPILRRNGAAYPTPPQPLRLVSDESTQAGEQR